MTWFWRKGERTAQIVESRAQTTARSGPNAWAIFLEHLGILSECCDIAQRPLERGCTRGTCRSALSNSSLNTQKRRGLHAPGPCRIERMISHNPLPSSSKFKDVKRFKLRVALLLFFRGGECLWTQESHHSARSDWASTNLSFWFYSWCKISEAQSLSCTPLWWWPEIFEGQQVPEFFIGSCIRLYEGSIPLSFGSIFFRLCVVECKYQITEWIPILSCRWLAVAVGAISSRHEQHASQTRESMLANLQQEKTNIKSWWAREPESLREREREAERCGERDSLYGHRPICDPHFCPKSHLPQFYSKNGQKKGGSKFTSPFWGGGEIFMLISGEMLQEMLHFQKIPYKNSDFLPFWGGARVYKALQLGCFEGVLI